MAKRTQQSEVGEFAQIPVEKLFPHWVNQRYGDQDPGLDKLVTSILEVGLLQPILVRPKNGENGEEYEIINGERRWRATKKTLQPTVLARVKSVKDELEAIKMIIQENACREDLNEIQKSRIVKILSDPPFELGPKTAGGYFKKSGSWASTHLRLLELPGFWLEKLENKELGYTTIVHGLLKWLDRPGAIEQITQDYKQNPHEYEGNRQAFCDRATYAVVVGDATSKNVKSNPGGRPVEYAALYAYFDAELRVNPDVSKADVLRRFIKAYPGEKAPKDSKSFRNLLDSRKNSKSKK